MCSFTFSCVPWFSAVFMVDCSSCFFLCMDLYSSELCYWQIPLRHSYSLTWWWSTAKDQVKHWSLVFTHNSICMNSFSSAQPFLTYLLEGCYMLHNSCVNYRNCHFAVCFACLLKSVHMLVNWGRGCSLLIGYSNSI